LKPQHEIVPIGHCHFPSLHTATAVGTWSQQLGAHQRGEPFVGGWERSEQESTSPWLCLSMEAEGASSVGASEVEGASALGGLLTKASVEPDDSDLQAAVAMTSAAAAMATSLWW